MFCPDCGTKIEDQSAQFCPGCGNALGTAAQPEHLVVRPAAAPAQAAQAPQPIQSAVAAPGPNPAVQPKRGMSGCAIAAIITGVIFALGAIGIAGLVFIIGAATSPASDALENYFALLGNNQDQAAYEQTTSDFFKTQTSPQQFQSFLNSNPAIRQVSDISYSNRQIENNNSLLEGSITVNDEKTAFRAALIKEGGAWKINGLVFGDAAQQ